MSQRTAQQTVQKKRRAGIKARDADLLVNTFVIHVIEDLEFYFVIKFVHIFLI